MKYKGYEIELRQRVVVQRIPVYHNDSILQERMVIDYLVEKQVFRTRNLAKRYITKKVRKKLPGYKDKVARYRRLTREAVKFQAKSTKATQAAYKIGQWLEGQ